MLRLFNFILLFAFLSVNAQDIPKQPNPPRLVNDFVGGLLTDAQKNMLEQKLVAYNDSTSTQIVVVIVKTTEPYVAADYALELGRKWGVGQKGKNNGIILLWAPGDRKISIQTGYGMEGVIPDMYAKRIITDVIGPNFKALQYYEGLNQGTDEIIKYASGEYKADPESEDGGFIGFIIIILIILFVFWLISRKNKNGGGGLLDGNLGGLPYTIFTGSGSQSGSWGGGSSGGGFGGFGGGSFGGGGASGDY